MLRSIIIDDEQHCLKALQKDLERHCPSIMLVDACNSAKEGVMSIKKNHPDLVFLDVEMPWMNGFEMLEMFDRIDFCIIFTTAYDKFAARAFRISAVDYLLKPVDANDLKVAVKKAEEKILASAGGINIQNLLHNIRQPIPQQRIAIHNREAYEFVPASTIFYCTAEGAYTKIVFKEKHPVIISKTLGDFEEVLPSEIFVRIHNSTVVNINEITHFVKSDGGYVVMSNGEKLIVSKSRKENLIGLLGLNK